MKKNSLWTFAVLLGLATATFATIIEGTTPSGKFKTVGLSETGGLQVSVSSPTTPSSAGAPATAQVTLTPNTPAIIYPADGSRFQGVICNIDSLFTVWVGSTNVTTNTGLPLLAGSCLSPDAPASFQAALFGVSTATLKVAYIYFR